MATMTDVTVQWADSILRLERLYLLKLAVWGGLAVAAGTLLFALGGHARRIILSVRSLAMTLLIGGVAVAGLAFLLRSRTAMRDLSGAVALDRTLWLVSGIALGLMFAAVVAAGRPRRRTAGDDSSTGIAIGVSLHAAAIAVLSLQLARAVVR
jgi:hypothetical protein